MNLFLFEEGDLQVVSTNFSGHFEKNFLRRQNPNVISAVLYGEETEYLFGDNGVKSISVSKSSEIELCADTKEWPRYSVEGAALNVSYFINKAHDTYTNATGVALSPVTLKIGPRIKQTVSRGGQNEIGFLTDNAFYQPESKTITFLPHSLEFRLMGKAHNYWEIPIVSAHEYGHHIFNSIIGGVASSGMQKTCFDSSLHYSPQIQGAIAIRAVKINDVLQSFNEGFADLIAFYTLSASERSLLNIKCMEKSRDVSSKVFMNGTPKTFTQNLLGPFFSPIKDQSFKNCDDVDPQAIHTIGAIFAHNADRFLTSLSATNEQRLVIIHEWANKLKLEHARLSTLPPQRYFEEIFKLFLRLSLQRFDRTFDRSSCDLVQEFYPDLLNRMSECN